MSTIKIMSRSIGQYLLVIILLVSGFNFVYGFAGQDEIKNEYDVRNIPSDMLKDADAIIRKKEIRFEYKNAGTAVIKERIAVTIFKKDEQSYGQKILWYSNFNTIDELEGIIYDAEGEEIRDLEKSDIEDYPAYAGYSIYADTRVRIAELYYDKYPYTIEFYTEIYLDGYISWPEWYSQTTLDPVQISRFEVLVPKDYELRYWCNRDYIKPLVSIEGSRELYTWEAKNLPELSRDAIGDDIEDVADNVKIAPHNFVIDGYKGNMTTWKDFGLWSYSLAKDKGKLPEAAVNEIKALIKTDDTEAEKVKKVYQYMQSRTRYVSVQLGIGGWQPFNAAYVHEKGYGDCKALSNYTVALLKEAGLNAYPVLINSGSHRYTLVSEFPSNQFNHVIVCVPLKNDTTWLECTSQSAPFGRIGKNNENRDALMITEEGGIIIRTPVSSAVENLQQRKISVLISGNGKIDADVFIEWSGSQQDYVRSSVVEATHDEKEKFISRMFEVPDLFLESYMFDGIDEKKNEVNAKLKLSLPHYGSISGSRLFFKPSLMERRTYVPGNVDERLSPVRFDYPYLDIDSIVYTLPAGYTVEAIPKEIKINTAFGDFLSRTEMTEDKKLLFIRRLEINTYSIPAENYNDYRNFFSEVVKADRAQVVLVKK